MKPTVVFTFLMVTQGACVALAQQAGGSRPVASEAAKPGEPADDLTAIRAGSEAFLAAFNKGDAKRVASFWIEDGQYIDDAGRQFAGRDAIEKAYAEFFAGNPGAVMKVEIDALRLLGPNTAIEDGRAVLEPAPAGEASVSRYTAVHVKVGGKWLMASVRDTWVETPAAARSAQDLEWLIGTWRAEEHSVQMESVCRWVVEGQFIERAYTTTQVDGTKTSGLQLIGWNPLAGHVQSWDFSSDGGHAVGVWSPTERGWQASVEGTTGDGTPTFAVNQLIRLDDNAYMWQSTQRSLGDVALPDTDEVLIKRRASN
jgi:uncharacterized protein (TIGR02246 family)